MQVLFILSLSATALGGALALGALYYFSRVSRETIERLEVRARSSYRGVSKSARAAELDRREQIVASYYAQTNAELSEKRAALERLTRQAASASAALDRALASERFEFGQTSASFSNERVHATPFEFCAFDDLSADVDRRA